MEEVGVPLSHPLSTAPGWGRKTTQLPCDSMRLLSFTGLMMFDDVQRLYDACAFMMFVKAIWVIPKVGARFTQATASEASE